MLETYLKFPRISGKMKNKKGLLPLAALSMGIGLQGLPACANNGQNQGTPVNRDIGEEIGNILKEPESTSAGQQPFVTAGKFEKIYDPSVSKSEQWYINDHTFVIDANGTWHLFGITHKEPADPMDEKSFAHATSPSLSKGPWKKQPSALEADLNNWGETHLWAPHIVKNNDLYYQFYCAGGSSHEEYRIHLATSADLFSWKRNANIWKRHAKNPLFTDGYDARDPMVLKEGEKYIMYYTATERPDGGHHIVACRESPDLINWGRRRTCYTDPASGTFGGPTESPFVVRRGEHYYLFIGPHPDYVGTDVYVSHSPNHWENSDLAGHIDSHAAEVIRDKDGKWYVSSAGWGQGGVYLAPLIWNDRLDDAASSLPVPAKRREK